MTNTEARSLAVACANEMFERDQASRRAFSTWASVARRTSSARHDASIVLTSMRSQSSRRAFTTWADLVECTLNAKERARSVLHTLRHAR